MDYKTLQQQWQAQPEPDRVLIDKDILLKELQRSKDNFASTIWWRDVREGGIALILGVVFSYFGWRDQMWTHGLMAAGCFFVVVFLCFDRRRQLAKIPQASDSLQDCIKTSLHQVEHQIWLLKNVFWWYLLSIVIGGLALGLHTAVRLSNQWHDILRETGKSSLTWIVLGFIVWLINQAAVKGDLEPRQRELHELKDSLSRTPDKKEL